MDRIDEEALTVAKPAPTRTEPAAITVGSYLTQINRVLATQRGRVKGEVTSISPSGKAIYFSIKDKIEDAQLNCLIWTSVYYANSLKLQVGDEIIVTGAPDIYAPYGKFSFKANTIEYAGEGALKRAYDKLRTALETEGLFAPEHKRALPEFPKKIGVITSMKGVVIQDFSANLDRHGFKVITIDARVEGKDAIHDLLAALRTMDKQDIDVLVVMRGGGSWESLQPFNTESVVRAIANFKVPVVTGIGHDVDVTLSEMVADIGCSTPTAVAEALNAPWGGLKESLARLETDTLGEFRTLLDIKQETIDDSYSQIFRSYERGLAQTRERTSDASSKIALAFSRLTRRVRDAHSTVQKAVGIMESGIQDKQRYLQRLPVVLRRQSQSYLGYTKRTLGANTKAITRAQADSIQRAAQSLQTVEKTIALNDPKRVMRLGYSLSYVNGKLARNIADITTGATIKTQLVDGEFTSEVKGVE